MAELENIGCVEAVCLSSTKKYPKYPQDEVIISPEGILGDAHSGRLRPSHKNPHLLKINDRMVSIVAWEVLTEVNEKLGLTLKPGDFNENILVKGLGDLSDLKGGDRFVFRNGLEIVVTGQNYPCSKLQDYNGVGIIKATASKQEGQILNKRGIVGVPNKTSTLAPGEPVFLRKAANE